MSGPSPEFWEAFSDVHLVSPKASVATKCHARFRLGRTCGPPVHLVPTRLSKLFLTCCIRPSLPPNHLTNSFKRVKMNIKKCRCTSPACNVVFFQLTEKVLHFWERHPILVDPHGYRWQPRRLLSRIRANQRRGSELCGAAPTHATRGSLVPWRARRTTLVV